MYRLRIPREVRRRQNICEVLGLLGLTFVKRLRLMRLPRNFPCFALLFRLNFILRKVMGGSCVWTLVKH